HRAAARRPCLPRPAGAGVRPDGGVAMSTDLGTTAGPAGPADPADTDAWRGRLPADAAAAAEAEDTHTSAPSARLDREARALLAELVRPHRRAVVLTFVLVGLQTLCFLAAPWLVG